jgi:hypothetical protein
MTFSTGFSTTSMECSLARWYMCLQLLPCRLKYQQVQLVNRFFNPAPPSSKLTR